MSAQRARLLVWMTLLTAMPVPLVVIGRGRMPVGALLQLAVVTSAVGVFERGDGAVGIIVTVLVLHVILWTVIAWLVSGVVVGAMRRLAGRGLGGATIVLVAVSLLVALLVPIYRSPFHASRARQTLLEVYG